MSAFFGARRMRWVRIAALLLPLLAGAPALPTHSAAYSHDSTTGMPALARYSSAAYSHDSAIEASLPDWMGGLPDSRRVSELSIPGTHDTMALYGGDQVQCQSASLAEQLQSGIRALDIRSRHINDRFLIHHGEVYQRAEFGKDVIEPVIAFLTAHPSETVLMRVKKEYSEQDNTRSFDETFEWYLSRYGRRVWKPNGSNPALGEIRGKIVILDNFSADGRYGLPWGNAKIQDKFHLNANSDLFDKWDSVRAHLNRADSGSMSDIYINFLSGAIGARPYFVASGQASPSTGAPRLWTGLLWDNQTGSTCGSTECYPGFVRSSCRDVLGARTCRIYFKGTNELTMDLLEAHGISRRTGIVMMDFPGAGLVRQIVEVNGTRNAY